MAPNVSTAGGGEGAKKAVGLITVKPTISAEVAAAVVFSDRQSPNDDSDKLDTSIDT